MGKSRPDLDRPLDQVTFQCTYCDMRFERAPERIEEAESLSHPFRYFAPCPHCGTECPQAGWERGLMNSYGKHTGPKTDEGRAAAAANLEGHPTVEEARRTRFNAMKHGMFAETATYFPAKPGAYPHCEGCEYRESVCHQQTACLKRTELFMRFHIAFDQNDPTQLKDLQANLHAMVWAIINDMMLAIVRTGVELKQPEWYFDPKGEKFHLVNYEDKNGEVHYSWNISAHPLLKILADFLSKNNMSLADLNMTPRVQGEQEIMEGYLEGQRESVEALQARNTAALENLSVLFERSQKQVGRDPVLIEYKEQQGDG